jgi:hypothetical protein
MATHNAWGTEIPGYKWLTLAAGAVFALLAIATKEK